MRAWAAISVVVIAAAACSTEEDPGGSGWESCQASDQALVKRAFEAVTGRLPRGQAEINVWEDAVRGLREAGLDDREVRKRLIDLLSTEDAYLLHWSDFFLDALQVRRRVTSSYFGGLSADCFGPVGIPELPTVAEWVRDHSPREPNPEAANFTVGRLLTSSIRIDDLSPYYRAGLFQLMTTALPGMNVDPLQLEWTRRKVLGESFQEIYLNRNITCLKCHNSEFSLTYDADPALNRAWPVEGYFERALYGDPEASADPMTFHSVFRHSDVLLGSEKPWGWASQFCSSFQVPAIDDPLGYEVAFGSIKSSPEIPLLGRRASVWNLEHALRRGIDTAAAAGAIARDPDDPLVIAEPDQALAYLVATSVAEDVWEEVMGGKLTIANHFPRTEVARDTLGRLADAFLFSHFSLKTLLLEIVADPFFNLAAPSAGCGGEPYPLPRIFDPWTDRESDPIARGNSVGDAVHARAPRSLARSLHALMNWPPLPDFPLNADGDFQSAIGFFLSASEPGFRGFGADSRLVWEDRYGRCDLGQADWLSELVGRASAQGASIEDVVVALKDRLINEPWIDAVERAPLEDLIGASLADVTAASHEPGVRLACGAYVSSPQFLLAGLPSKDTRDVPKLTAEADGYDAICKTLALRLKGTGASWSIECSPGTLRVRLS